MPQNDTIAYWKQQAAEAGVNWPDMVAAYKHIRQAHLAEISDLINLRMAIWAKFVGPAKLMYRHAFTEGDQTMIPGWDLIATAVAAEMHITHDNIADYLWEIARKDKPVPPDVNVAWAAALEECLACQLDFNPHSFIETEF